MLNNNDNNSRNSLNPGSEGQQDSDDLSSLTITKPKLKIHLLTFNIFMRPPLIKNQKSDFKDDRLAQIPKKIEKYDIVCFQEIFQFFNKRKYLLKKESLKHGFKFFAENDPPGFFEGFVIGGGLLTLSKHPIIRKKFYTFKNCSHVDKIAKKGVLYTKISIFGDVVHLFNTHLQASYNSFSRDRKSYIARIGQILEMRRFLKKILKEEDYKKSHLVLLCGDFNICANGFEVDLEEYKKVFKGEFENFSKKNLYKEKVFKWSEPERNKENEKEKGYKGDKNENEEILGKMAKEKPEVVLVEDPKLENPKITEYDLMIHVLSNRAKWRLKDHHRLGFLLNNKEKDKKMATFGDFYIEEKTGKKIPYEQFLTLEAFRGWSCSIDYILEIFPFEVKKGEYGDFDDLDLFKDLEVEEGSCKSNFMTVEGREYTHLSDHYAVECVLRHSE